MIKNIAVFAGTFDPFTIGHYDIACRASKVFDKIIVGVTKTVPGGKQCFLSPDERALIAETSIKDIPNAKVKIFDGFLVDFAKSENAGFIVRGLRTFKDFEYEKALFEVYKSQNPSLEIFHLISSHNYNHISSSVVKELSMMGGDVTGYVHPSVQETVKKLYGANHSN